MARDNYSYKKYQKELAQKKKREEKLQSKLDKKNMQTKAHLALSDGKCAAFCGGTSADRMASAPLSAENPEQASNDGVTVV